MEATVLLTPNLPSDMLGIDAATMERRIVPLRRDVWLVLVWQPAAIGTAARPGTWTCALASYAEADATAYVASAQPSARTWLRVAQGFAWEAREVWLPRNDTPPQITRLED